jgi:molecular chaperone Hsp33
VEQVVAEQGCVEVGCDYCGVQYRFDAVDAGQLFADMPSQAPGSSSVQ